MTRFARAKGSKASNERKEEEATPWHVMRLQSSENNNKIDLSSDVNLKYILNTNKDSNKEEIWCDFDDLDRNNKPSSIVNNLLRKVKENKLCDSAKRSITNKDTEHQPGERVSNQKPKLKANNKSLKKSHFTVTYNNSKTTELNLLSGSNTGKGESNVYTCSNNKGFGKGNKVSVEQKIPLECGIETTPKGKKRKNKISTIDNANLNSYEVMPIQKNIGTSISSYSTKENEMKLLNNPKTIQTESLHRKKKPNKICSNVVTTNNSNCLQTIFVNGREIKLVQYEGFFIKKNDAVRLKNLRKQLKIKGIEKEKINTIMKLERRKAEKALAREKRNVCFHCRKFGHNFGDCPLIKGSEMSKSGLCFKCGSTEHSYYQCKVLKNEDFRHATCFICKEQGHISRQCSLNPQGQYPKGGCCHLCGEVTHLRKNCPKAINEKPASSLTLESFNNVGLENSSEANVKVNKLSHKIVTF